MPILKGVKEKLQAEFSEGCIWLCHAAICRAWTQENLTLAAALPAGLKHRHATAILLKECRSQESAKRVDGPLRATGSCEGRSARLRPISQECRSLRTWQASLEMLTAGGFPVLDRPRQQVVSRSMGSGPYHAFPCLYHKANSYWDALAGPAHDLT